MRQEQKLVIALPKERRLSGVFNEIGDYANLSFDRKYNRSTFGFITDLYDEDEFLRSFDMFSRYGWALNKTIDTSSETECEKLDDYFQKTPIPEVEAILEKQDDMFASMENYGVSAAIMGSDKWLETKFQRDLQSLSPIFKVALRFKKLPTNRPCSLMISAPQRMRYPEQLNGQRIATPYPFTLRNWLDEKKVTNVDIVYKRSNIEDCVRRNIADSICNIVQTGQSVFDADLFASLELRRVYPVMIDTRTPDSEDLKSLKSRLKLAVNPSGPLPRLN